MPIFRLEDDTLFIAQETNLELESHLEDWLENSPVALIQDELILWIGRQTSAADEEGTIFPDLLGIDAEGNLVIVELKRDRAPREVVAQLLEYAAWSHRLTSEQIQQIAEDYFDTRDEIEVNNFNDAFADAFDIPENEELPPLNRNLRLFIVAGEIPSRVIDVCRFLRNSHGMDINCIDVSTFETEAGERLVNIDVKVGNEEIISSKSQNSRTTQDVRWSGDKTVKQVVWEAVQELMKGEKEFFSPKEVTAQVLDKYPDYKPSNVGCEITADCINHPSRHHYSGGRDRYWKVTRGKYRLFDPEKDKIEDLDDSIQA